MERRRAKTRAKRRGRRAAATGIVQGPGGADVEGSLRTEGRTRIVKEKAKE